MNIIPICHIDHPNLRINGYWFLYDGKLYNQDINSMGRKRFFEVDIKNKSMYITDISKDISHHDFGEKITFTFDFCEEIFENDTELLVIENILLNKIINNL